MPIIIDPPETDPVIRYAGRLLDGDLWARLGDVTFGMVDDTGAHLWLSKIDGWFSPPGSTGSAEQRSAQDGAWLTPAYDAARGMTLLSRIYGRDWAHVEQVIGRVVEAIPVKQVAPLEVNSAGRTLVAMVRQDGDPLVDRNGAAAEVSLSLVAPDPRRYDIDPTSASTRLPQTSGGLSLPLRIPVSVGATVAAGLLTVSNDGNADTPPTLTVTGPCPPFTITHLESGRTLRVYDAVGSGRVLTITTSPILSALLDGSTPRAVAGAAFTYAPGVNTLAFSAATYDPAAVLTSTHRSAWR